MRKILFLVVSVIALSGSNAEADQPQLFKAASFVLLEGDEQVIDGPSSRTLVTKDHGTAIYQTDKPCVFQTRAIEGNPHAIRQIDFSKIKEWHIFVPLYAHFRQLRLTGDVGLFCKNSANDSLIADPHWLVPNREDEGCESSMDFRGLSDHDLTRLRDAVSFVTSNYCGYSGKPY